MKTAKQLRAVAWNTLTGRYWIAVLASIIATVLGGASGSSGGTATGSGSANAANVSTQMQTNIPPEAMAVITTIVGIIAAVVLISCLVLLVIGGAVELGYNAFNLRMYETREKPSLNLLFSRFHIFGKALLLRILIIVKTLLWTLLFFIPGIIASFRYAMAPYVLAEHPELTASEAIAKSKELMAGNKWRLFCLHISFIGWILLSLVTLGIGYIFLAPYMKAAETAFYLELTGRQAATAQAATVETAPAQL